MEWRKAKCEYTRLIKKKKRECWDDFCTREGTLEPWKVTRFAKGCWGNGDRMGHLVDDEGTVVEEDCDKVPLLRRKLFGDSPPQSVKFERGREAD